MSRPSARCTSKVDQTKARQLNISSQDIASYLQMSLTGYTITQFRERDKLIGVDLRAPERDRVDPSQIERLAIPSQNGTAVPLAALGHFTYGLEYGVVWERDREPTITVQSDVLHNAQGIDVTNRVNTALVTLRKELPVGYRVEIGGTVEENAKAQASINAQMPLLLVAVLVLLMVQLQSFSRVLMVVLSRAARVDWRGRRVAVVPQALRVRGPARDDRHVRHHHA